MANTDNSIDSWLIAFWGILFQILRPSSSTETLATGSSSFLMHVCESQRYYR